MFSSNTSQVSSDANYIESCFSTYLYTGNGSTQTITNGIDLAGKGGLVWLKSRSAASFPNHTLFDTARGAGSGLASNTTAAQNVFLQQSFLSSGFSLGNDALTNESAQTYASWTFRKQPKFFTQGTYTGNSVSGRALPHDLGSAPGCVIIKPLVNGQWTVYHRGLGTHQYVLKLNTTDAQILAQNAYFTQAPTSTNIFLGNDAEVNDSGVQYVYYAFAHNAGGFGLTGTDNVISCGSFTIGGSGNATVDLGFEPQWVMTKATDVAGNWRIADVMRGMTANGTDAVLNANLSNAEASANLQVAPTATGFQVSGGLPYSATYIYIAIRRGPMKTPTSGTSVYSAALGAGNATETAGFPVDLLIDAYTVTLGTNKYVFDRLRGGGVLYTNTAGADSGGSTWTFDSNTTAKDLLRGSDTTIFWNFRRAPGFFDEVCYTGTGTNGQTYAHSLGVVPEMMIVKSRSLGSSWYVYTATTGNTNTLVLNSTDAVATRNVWGDTTPTASVFSVGLTGNGTNNSGATYVAYLFASCPGVSKVGSYTGDGTTGRVINCGFTGGARFILIKRTDLSGPWYVWDSTRGIGAALDPYLALNNTDEQIQTSDSVDPNSSGFIVNQVGATNINVSGGTYLFFAVS